VTPIATYTFTQQDDGTIRVVGGAAPYTLTRDAAAPDGWRCDCPGYRYRQSCKHAAFYAAPVMAKWARRKAALAVANARETHE